MNDGALIDRIVADVLATLNVGQASRLPVEPPSSAGQARRLPYALIPDRVVTAAVLEQAAPAGQLVRLAADAVLTPSARDYLRTHGLKVERADAGDAAGAASRLVLVVTAPTGGPRVLRDAAAGWRSELSDTAADAADRAVSAVCRGDAEGVAVLTDRPERVACLANRNDRVAAVPAADAAALKRIRRDWPDDTAAPNVVCFDPTGLAIFALRTLMTEAAR